MTNTQSKVLILDDSEEARTAIKAFCIENHLMALTSRSDDPISVLKSFVDLGAIFISESIHRDSKDGLDLAAEIHHIRPELPIFFRCASETIELFQNIFLNRGICCAYQIDEIDELKNELKGNIFNQHYPNTLLRGIEEIASTSLGAIFANVDIEYSAPYLVKDRIIFGELFSLIPIESNWCKGYMMLQTSQNGILQYVQPDKISRMHNDDFRSVNDVLSELTNMIWGGVKTRFISEDDRKNIPPTQIPIIVNHANHYITFGTSTPQLCFQYTLKCPNDDTQDLTIYHKFIFNINWAPEHFKGEQNNLDAQLDSGELEFF